MEGTAGYQEYVTLVVPHGCGASPTTRLRIRIPEVIDILVPEDKPGWEIQIVTRKLDAPIRGEGATQIERPQLGATMEEIFAERERRRGRSAAP